PRLHLDRRLDVIERLAEQLERSLLVLRSPLRDTLQRTVHDPLGNGLLAAAHDHVDEFGEHLVAVLRVRQDLAARGLASSRHMRVPTVVDAGASFAKKGRSPSSIVSLIRSVGSCRRHLVRSPLGSGRGAPYPVARSASNIAFRDPREPVPGGSLGDVLSPSVPEIDIRIRSRDSSAILNRCGPQWPPAAESVSVPQLS